MSSRKRRKQHQETPDEDSDVEMEDAKKPTLKTMTDEERHKMLQADHELQLVAAGEQPPDLFLAEYETPQPYRRPLYIPTIYQMPNKKR